MFARKYLVFERIEEIILANTQIKDPHTGFCWLVKSVEQINEPVNLAVAFTLPSEKFTIGIDRTAIIPYDDQSLSALSKGLMRFFFADSYLKVNDIPLLLFFGTAEVPGSLSLIPFIEQHCLDHGFQDISIIDQSDPQQVIKACNFADIIGENDCNFAFKQFFDKWIEHVAKTGNIEPPLLFVNCQTLAGSEEILENLNEKEVTFFGQENIFTLLAVASGIYKNALRGEKRLKFLEGQMIFKTNASNFNAEEAQKVIQWYHKEYEVLPLWYKRFGHIIKVLMGKRSLKSLFE